MWFTETGSHTGGEGIGLIDQGGSIREFELPAGTRPFGIAKGAEGSAWFTEVGSHWGIGQVTLAGDITEFPVDLHNVPLNIVAGPDGAMWFTEDGIVNGGSGAIGRIAPTGELTEYILPTLPGYSSGAGDITVGPDGNLWFTWAAQRSTEDLDAVLSSVGRITPAGVITEFPLSLDQGWPPGGITRGRDGNLWLTHGGGNAIVRISVTGTITSFPLPNESSSPVDITRGEARCDVVHGSERDRTIQGATRRHVHRTTRTCRGSRKRHVRSIPGCPRTEREAVATRRVATASASPSRVSSSACGPDRSRGPSRSNVDDARASGVAHASRTSFSLATRSRQ